MEKYTFKHFQKQNYSRKSDKCKNWTFLHWISQLKRQSNRKVDRIVPGLQGCSCTVSFTVSVVQPFLQSETVYWRAGASGVISCLFSKNIPVKFRGPWAELSAPVINARLVHSKSEIRSDVLTSIYFYLCHKDTAQGTKSPRLGAFLAFYCVSIA